MSLLNRKYRVFVAVAIVWASEGTAIFAQSPRPSRYQPRRPTVSPYLDLFRGNNNSLLPNYFTFVRPKQQIQAFEREQLAANAAVVRTLRQQSALIQESTARGAGRVGGFMNTLQFYPRARGR